MHPSYPPTWSQTLSFLYKSQVYPTWREIKLSLGLLASALTQEEIVYIPMATLTSFQERSGFQQHKYIILHFWKSEVQTQSH